MLSIQVDTIMATLFVSKRDKKEALCFKTTSLPQYQPVVDSTQSSLYRLRCEVDQARRQIHPTISSDAKIHIRSKDLCLAAAALRPGSGPSAGKSRIHIDFTIIHSMLST